MIQRPPWRCEHDDTSAEAITNNRAQAIVNAAVQGFSHGGRAFRVNPETGNWESRLVANEQTEEEDTDDTDEAPDPATHGSEAFQFVNNSDTSNCCGAAYGKCTCRNGSEALLPPGAEKDPDDAAEALTAEALRRKLGLDPVLDEIDTDEDDVEAEMQRRVSFQANHDLLLPAEALLTFNARKSYRSAEKARVMAEKARQREAREQSKSRHHQQHLERRRERPVVINDDFGDALLLPTMEW